MALSEVKYLLDNGHTIEAMRAYVSNHGTFNPSHYEESYDGEFRWESEAEEHLVEIFLECMGVPDNIANYIDEAAILRDMLFDFDIIKHGKAVYLFRAC